MLSFFIAQALVSAAVLLLASIFCIGMRRSSAALRYFVWVLAFITILATPLCAWIFAPVARHVAVSRAVPVVTVTMTATSVTKQTAFAPPASHLDWNAIAASTWAIGCGLVLVRTGTGLVVCSRRRRQAAAMPGVNSI